MIKVITIADDDNDLKVISKSLSEAFPKARFIISHGGTDGKEKSLSESPDLIILDPAVADAQGYNTWQMLKSDALLKQIPLIILTPSVSEAKSHAKLMNIKAEAFVSAPVDEYELKTLATALIQLKKSQELTRFEKSQFELEIQTRTLALESELETRKETEKKLLQANQELETQKLNTVHLLEDLKKEILERTQTELLLQNSEEQLRTLINAMPDIVCFKDSHGRWLVANNYDLNLFGLQDVAYKGKTDTELAEYSSFYREAFLHCEASDELAWEKGVPCRSDETIPRPDGTSMIFDVIKIPGFDADGNRKGLAVVGRDITERKQAEKELQKLSQVVQQSPASIIVTDVNGVIEYVNPAACLISGYSLSELIGSNTSIFSSGKMSKEELDTMWATIKSGHEWKGEFNNKRKNGELYWEQASISVLKNPEGEINNYLSIQEDITERKLSELEFQKLSQVVEQSPDSIIVTDLNGIIEYINRATSHISGYPIEELVGKNPSVLSSGKTPPEVYIAMWDAIANGNEWKGELLNRRKTGELYWERASISPLLNPRGEPSHFLAIKEDITDRKHNESIQKVLFNIARQVIETSDVEQLLAIIKNELNILIDTKNFYVAFYSEDTGMLTSAYGSDEKDSITTWPAEKSLTGYMIKQNKSLLLKQNDFKTLIETGEIGLIGTMSEIWLGVPLRVDNKPYGAFVIQDYHNPNAYSENDLKMLEFIASQVSLSIQRQKSLIDLKNALGKAEADDRLKTAFINNISHEIRTPLNGILGFSEMTLNPDSTPEDNELYHTIIKKSSKRLLNTITSYMDISMIVSGTMEISRRPTDADKLMKEIYNDFNEVCSLKNLEFKILKPDSPNALILNTDIEKIRKIITHLLDNAVKFTPKGTITFGYERHDMEIRFLVSDTGTGIVPEALNVIFDAFMQADVSPSRGYEGSGLGLAIARGLVKLLGGKLWVDTVKDQGSTFYFTLPLAENPIIVPRKVVETPYIAPAFKPLILVAEDDDSNYKYIEIVLMYASYKVIRAENGIDAIECCRKHPEIRLALMDIKMPLMDGFEATRQIRTFRPDLPVIALTAHVTTEDENAAIAAGCNEYVTKPVSKARLLEIINNSLTLNN